jgi:hypothetical protein
VANLCNELYNGESAVDCFGFCLDTNGLLRGLYTPEEIPPKPLGECVSLAQILAAKRQRRWENLRPWNMEERHILSIILASSFIQLHQTEWMESGLNACSIIFGEPSSREDSIDVRHPFLAKMIHAEPQKSVPTRLLINSDDYAQRQKDC